MFPVGVATAEAAAHAAWLPAGPTSAYGGGFIDWRTWSPDHQRWVERIFSRCTLRTANWKTVFVGDPDFGFLMRVASGSLRLLGGAGDAVPGTVPGPLMGGALLPPVRGRNVISSAAAAAAVDADVAEGLRDFKLTVPPPGLRSQRIHPLLVVPKGAGEWRIVHNLSFGGAFALNAYISYFRFRWSSVEDALCCVRRGCWFARVDMASYYRHFPVHPADWHLQAFIVRGVEYWDAYLEFGLKNAVEYGHRTSQAIGRVFRRRGFGDLICIMDDMLVVRDGRVVCERAYGALRSLLGDLGLQVSPKPTKTHGPAQQTKFCGLLLDSVAMTVRLDAEKLAKTAAAVDAFRGRASCSIHDLQSLLGLLNYVSQVVYGGRTYTHRLLEVLRHAARRDDGSVLAPSVSLDADFHADLAWWGANLAGMNGLRRILDANSFGSTCFFTDANLDDGIGVFFGGGHAGLTFEQCAVAVPAYGRLVAGEADPIHLKELYAVLVAVVLFVDALADCVVVVRTDNMVVESAINKGVTRANDARMMQFVRELHSISVRYNFRLVARYVPTLDNSLADALSRQQWDRFSDLHRAWRLEAGLAADAPVPIPDRSRIRPPFLA